MSANEAEDLPDENEPDEDELDEDEDQDEDDDSEDEGDDELPKARDAAEELSEAFDHFKNAAGILFKSATTDPNVRGAAKTAERTFKKIGASAEPLARQLAGELSKMTKTVVDTVEGAIDSKKAKKSQEDEEEEE